MHAGGDEADGDPVYGTDAIWSHRWNAQIHPFGTGPEAARRSAASTSVRAACPTRTAPTVTIPNNPTGVWVNDYTIQPENGGLASSPTSSATTSACPTSTTPPATPVAPTTPSSFWTLMSQSRGTAPSDPGIGDQPHAVRRLGEVPARLARLRQARRESGRTYGASSLRPSRAPRRRTPNGLVVLLPDKDVDARARCARAPTVARRYFYSDKGNDLDNTMTRDVRPWPVPAR